MAHPLTLPTIGVLALVGVGLGVHLGNESISEINPIYFQEPPTRFHSDLGAYRSPAAANYVPRVDPGSPLELGAGCIGCRTYPEEYRPARDPAVDRALEGVPEPQAPAQLAVAEAPPDAAVLRRRADLDRLQRYASFAITSEPATHEAVAVPSDGEATAIQGDELAAAD